MVTVEAHHATRLFVGRQEEQKNMKTKPKYLLAIFSIGLPLVRNLESDQIVWLNLLLFFLAEREKRGEKHSTARKCKERCVYMLNINNITNDLYISARR